MLGALGAGAEPLQLAAIVAPILGGAYGYWRAGSSNRRRAASVTRAGSSGGAA
jgi:hypothetical protein